MHPSRIITSYQNPQKMWLFLLLSLLFHSLTVSSLKPPSVASLLQQNNELLTKNLTNTNIIPTATVGEFNASQIIREAIEMVDTDPRFNGSSLDFVWFQGNPYGVDEPTSLLGCRGFHLQFFQGNNTINVGYRTSAPDKGWERPHLAPSSREHGLAMQWEELQSLVSLEEADRLMALAGYGGRGILSAIMSNKSGRGLGYSYLLVDPYEKVSLSAVTGKVTKVSR